MLKVSGLLNLASKTFRIDNNKVVKVNDRINKTFVNLFKINKSQKLTCIPNIGAIKKPIFLIFNAIKAFNFLKQAFIKALIFRQFNLKSYIWIVTDVSGYVIDKVLD